MTNNRGSILVATTGFVLVFTLLLFASIYMCTVHNEQAEERKFSEGALWLAEGALERVRSNLPTIISLETDTNLGTEGTYDILEISLIGTDRWRVQTSGTVNTQSRAIEVEIARFDIENAITTEGTVNDDCLADGNAQINGICAQGMTFSFESVFNGLSKQDIKNLATQYDNYSLNNIPANGNIPSVSGITYISYQGTQNDSLHVAENDADSGFLVIDASGSTGTITFNVTGGSFNGIIWVIGDVSVTGNPDINGTMFVENYIDTKVGGTANVSYDAAAINDAISDIGSIVTSKAPYIVSWKEI